MNFCIMKFQALSYDSSQIICKNNAENIVQDYATLNLSMLSSQKQIKILEELCHSPPAGLCVCCCMRSRAKYLSLCNLRNKMAALDKI